MAAPVFTYDGATSPGHVSVTFASMDPAATYQLYTSSQSGFVTYGQQNGGPYGVTAAQTINLNTTGTPTVGDVITLWLFDAGSFATFGAAAIVWGTPGLIPVNAAFTYDGATTATLSVNSTNAAYKYQFSSDDGSSTDDGPTTGTGGTLGFTINDIGGLAPGQQFTLYAKTQTVAAGGFVNEVLTVRIVHFGSTTVSEYGADFVGEFDGDGAGGVRVAIAFDDPTLEPNPTWTDVTAISPSLVAGYEISRGEEDEFLGPVMGTARATINDREGILDPTNAAGPYYTLIEPFRQIRIDLWNPVTSEWSIRFRGFIEDYDYVPAPWTHENVDGDHVGNMALELSCVDLTAILTRIEMQPNGSFGDTVPAESNGNIFFEDNASAKARIEGVLGNAGIDEFWFTVFTLNISLQETVYSPSENVMQVIDDVVDAEFPTVSNRYVDRHGVLAVHGRFAKFDPDGTAADAGAAWDFHHWKCGDETTVLLSPSDTAQIREFAFNRGTKYIFNSAFCTPKDFDPDVDDIADQYFKDDPSIGEYGYGSWSAESLIIDAGTTTGNTGNEECLAYATFIVTNYKAPKNRVTRLVFKSMNPEDDRAAANWDLLCNVDISDMIDITLNDPGVDNTGGFNSEPFFVEGVTETASPLNGEYAMVTTTLSVSPGSYYDDRVGLDGV